VYDTQASDNEERSALEAGKLLGSLGLPAPLVDRVCYLVRATAHVDAVMPSDRDTAALLDADLAILGAAPERYLRYSRDIRLEYGWVPEASYRTGRRTVLQKFLVRPRIYHHRVTFEEREEQARRNIAGELSLLDDTGTI
jgi:predicted metal-dependent HD superfamily phosphohydrolase